MSVTIQLKRDTAANWTSKNPTLAQGEMGLETDTGALKWGDGSTAWTSLGYFTPSSEVTDATVTSLTGLLKGDGSNVGTATAGTDYLAPDGDGSSLTGITATQVGADASGAADDAQSAAETFATDAVATETSRAETAEALLAPLASPALTGEPTAPTAAGGDTSTQLANDAFVFANTRMVANVKSASYGAGGDAKISTTGDGHITSGSAAFTSASGSFTSADVGQYIEVAGAGTSGATLVTTITAYTSATAVTLATTAGTTVTTADYTYGTDDTTAIQAALDAAVASPFQCCYIPPGEYLTGPLTVPPQVTVQGANGLSYLENPTGAISRLILKKGSAGALISPYDGGAQYACGVKIWDLMLDTNMVAEAAINLADQDSNISRCWLIERDLIVNSGYSSSTNGYHVYIGNQNSAVVMRDCQLLSNAAGVVTTQDTYGWDGVGWYGTDGLWDNNFVGCYANAGLQVLGGASNITLTVRGGGLFWNLTNIVVGGSGATIVSVSIDHAYNDGIYAGYPFTAIGCGFHSSSIETNNNWSHVNNAVTNGAVTLIGCYAAPRDGDTGNSNNPAYMVNCSGSGSSFNDIGNYLVGSPVFGTGWTNGGGLISVPPGVRTRVGKRVLATSAPGATPSIDTDNYDVVHLTGLSAAITSMTSDLSGTPVDGDTLRVSFTDTGTARAIAWGNSFESGAATLPTTTVASTRLDTELFWNTETSKWRCMAAG